MAGHPDRVRSIGAARSLAALPIAALELGIPFSDPLADGPVIQRAGQAALEAGTTVAGCLEIAAAVSGRAPIVFMTYVNPILSYGPERFAADAASAGVAGVILPDLPPEESESVVAALHGHGLATVFMVAPTSSEERIRLICDASSGFVYCVTLTGITGVRTELPDGVAELLGRVHMHRSEEDTSELQSHSDLVCRLLLGKKQKCVAWLLPSAAEVQRLEWPVSLHLLAVMHFVVHLDRLLSFALFTVLLRDHAHRVCESFR